MSTLDSSSVATESTMDPHHHHHHQTLTKRHHSSITTTTTTTTTANTTEESGDSEVWETLNSNFRQVQTVLDRNRILIQQVNANHQSRVPDNMIKNVALIQEINGNISKVVSLYSDLSSNFSTMYNQRSRNTSCVKTGIHDP